MELPEEGVLLRIFIGESDKYEGLITMEKATIRFYKPKPGKPSDQSIESA
ncbi:MAG: hypothetical protein WC231_07280 [Dehalococcoidales bacterium]